MQYRTCFAIVCSVALTLAGCGKSDPMPTGPVVPREKVLLPDRVAHAGARVRGVTYTNSLEALDSAYEAGYRLFEIDFEWTSDDRLVCIHDWDETYRALFPGMDHASVPTHEQFMGADMAHDLRQSDLDGLLAWLDAHTEARVVTDTKSRPVLSLERIAQRAGDRFDRFVPQIYKHTQAEKVVALGYEQILWTLYRSRVKPPEARLAWAERLPTQVVGIVMPDSTCLDTDLARRLRERNFMVYVHTVNDPTILERTAAAGANGWYTDDLAPAPAGVGD